MWKENPPHYDLKAATKKNDLQHIQKESCQPIKRLKGKKTTKQYHLLTYPYTVYLLRQITCISYPNIIHLCGTHLCQKDILVIRIHLVNGSLYCKQALFRAQSGKYLCLEHSWLLQCTLNFQPHGKKVPCVQWVPHGNPHKHIFITSYKLIIPISNTASHCHISYTGTCSLPVGTNAVTHHVHL
jgi:hypothetical protein